MEAGTGTTVGPEEPMMVLDVVAGPDVVLTGTGMTVVPSEPLIVLLETVIASVPVEVAVALGAVSLGDDIVALLSGSMVDPAVVLTESVAEADNAVSVGNWLDNSEFKDEAALDRMLEKPEERDWDTAASVAVAATLDRSELNEDAKLDKAEEAASVAAVVVVAAELSLAWESTDD